MSFNIPFIFGLSPEAPPISEKSDLWSAPLPSSRQAFTGSPTSIDSTDAISYGDYFTAARDFLTREDCALLTRTAGVRTLGAVAGDDIRQVAVYLLKHGAFYHPACVVLNLSDRQLNFVLNVAVSSQGRKILAREFECLARLNAAASTAFWPQVYAEGHGRASQGADLPMFMGQWLSGFYEFHLSRQTGDGRMGVVIWDTDRGHYMLEDSQAPALMRRAAAILTSAYNPLTFESVLDWHHAAGDFVVRTSDGRLDLRQITVRNYAPLIRNSDPDIEAVLDGLLMFLVHLSVRLRMDRLDGVGAAAAYPGEVVPAIYEGFRQGLAMSLDSHGLPEDLIPAAEAYFALHGPEQLAPLAEAALSHMPPASDEGRLWRDLIDDHLGLLAGSFTPADGARIES